MATEKLGSNSPLTSRLSIKNNEFATTSDGWRPCLLKNHFYEQCYGLMHIPASKMPNTAYAQDSVEHFEQGIQKLIDLTTLLAKTYRSFSPLQQTRIGLAAYDAGVQAVQSKGE